MKRIAAGIVTYNPDLVRLNENIKAIQFQVAQIIVIDNGSNQINEIEKLCEKYVNVLLIKNNKNIGIAAALNILMKTAADLGYNYLLTLDQDSVVENSFVENLYDGFSNDEAIAIVCPIIRDRNRQTNPIKSNQLVQVKRCITSGSLTSINAWKKVGGFDESMFIDGVDFDFCDRLNRIGLKIIQTSSACLLHEIGHITRKRILIWNINVKNHSAFRKYYIARNIVYLDRKNHYRFYPFSTLARVIKQELLVLLFEDDKRNKLLSLHQGMIAGFKAKLDTDEISV